ncbi:MAG: GGDEF domain-containing protein, partial [Pseudomonadota bacterium]
DTVDFAAMVEGMRVGSKGFLVRWVRERMHPKLESRADVLRVAIGSTIVILAVIALGELAISTWLGTNLWMDLVRGMVLGTLVGFPAFLFNATVLHQNVILQRKFRSAYRIAARNSEDIISKNQELEAAQMRLAELANSDFLTGLANRRRFEQSFADAFGAAGLGGAPFTLILLDLDNFKQVNDAYGHDAGDAVLQNVAKRIRATIGERPGVAARLGGDEFAILLWETFDGADAAAFASELQDVLSRPHSYRGKALHAPSTVSVGFYSIAFSSASEMFVATDKALLGTKRSDRIGFAKTEPDDELSIAS